MVVLPWNDAILRRCTPAVFSHGLDEAMAIAKRWYFYIDIRDEWTSGDFKAGHRREPTLRRSVVSRFSNDGVQRSGGAAAGG
jgi:hypothetical protein